MLMIVMQTSVSLVSD